MTASAWPVLRQTHPVSGPSAPTITSPIRRGYEMELSAELRVDATSTSIAPFLTSTSPLIAGTGADAAGVGTSAWSTPGNITASDSNSATNFLDSDEQTHWLKATNFGFAIPGGVVVAGIAFTLLRDSTATQFINANTVNARVVKGGAIGTSADLADEWVNWPSGVSSKVYGSSSELWGETWTVADINNSGFGFALSVIGQGEGGLTVGVGVDSVSATVYYTVPGSEVALTGAPPVRFGPDESDAGRILTATNFATEMPGGFSNADLNVQRPEFFNASDYLMASSTIREYDTGRVLHEGRVTGVSEDQQGQVTFEIEGWAKHLADDHSARVIFYDRDQSGWQGMSVQRKLDISSGNVMITDATVTPDLTTGSPSVETSMTGPWTLARTEGWYDAQGLIISFIDFAWKKNDVINNADANWAWRVYASTTDTLTTFDNTANLIAAGPGSGTLTTTSANKKFGVVELVYAAASASTGLVAFIAWTMLGVVGDHALTLRGAVSAPTTGRGLYASDMIQYAVQTWAPLLTIGDIESTSGFTVPHSVYKDPLTAQEIIEGLLVYGGTAPYYPLDYYVWEGRTFGLASPGNHGTTWRVRREDGVTAQSAGADAQDLVNGVIVRWTDGAGTQHTTGPPGSDSQTENALLQDTSDSNPANRDGARHWQVWDAGITSPAGALLIGQTILADRSVARIAWRGDVTIPGQVRDSAGNYFPVAMVRAGDSLVLEDDEDVRPRRIVNTSYDHASRSVTCSVGAQPDRLEVLLAKLSIVLTGRL